MFPVLKPFQTNHQDVAVCPTCGNEYHGYVDALGHYVSAAKQLQGHRGREAMLNKRYAQQEVMD